MRTGTEGEWVSESDFGGEISGARGGGSDGRAELEQILWTSLRATFMFSSLSFKNFSFSKMISSLSVIVSSLESIITSCVHLSGFE